MRLAQGRGDQRLLGAGGVAMALQAARPAGGDARAMVAAAGSHGADAHRKGPQPRGAILRLFLYLRPHKLLLALVFFFIVVCTVLGLMGPYLMGVAIDRFIGGKDLVGLARISLWMLAVYVCNNLFQAAAAWIMAIVSQRALQQLRHDLFHHLQTLSLSFFDHNPAGELMSRLVNDIDVDQPGGLAKCHGALCQRAVVGRHHHRHVCAESLAGAGDAAGRAHHALGLRSLSPGTRGAAFGGCRRAWAR